MYDEKYFNDIWGTVHRHDYCHDLAERLISQYGKCRILDIGTGCGYLVKVLREKGCDAWGTEISAYALENTCAPGFVVYGDVRNLPFKDNSFDLVHSQGLWTYVPENEVDGAVKECYRVGKAQHHNIDHDKTDWAPEYLYLTWKPLEWWNEKLKPPKVLVACPTYEGKEYCFQEWIDNVKNLTYENYDILVVDNSKTEDFYNRWKDKIPMIHMTFDPSEKDDNMYRVCKSMARIQEHFMKGNYTHWMNIEADVIPPKNVIETMMKYGQDADWVEHCYPADANGNLQQGIGCGLLSRQLMIDFPWYDEKVADDSPDSELWNWVKGRGGYKTVELWYIMDVKHIK